MPIPLRAAVRTLAVLLALCSLPGVAEARRAKKPAPGPDVFAADRVAMQAEQLRDRGDLDGAVALLRAELARDPKNIGAHMLYQQLAALGRRSGRLVEAEYAHWLAEAPDDAFRILTHAAAMLSAAAAEPGRANREVLRQVQKKLAAAEADPGTFVAANIVAADLAASGGELEEAEQRLRAVLDRSPKQPAARSDLLLLLAARGDWGEAVTLCEGLLVDAPWRLEACAPLFPARSGEKAADQADQERLVGKLEAVETASKDPVVLQSLASFYDRVDEKKGARRVREALAAADPTWTPSLRRNPYVEGLPDGELTDDEIELLEALSALHDERDEDPLAVVHKLQSFLDSVPEDTPRIAAMAHRELGYALRDDAILDRDGSRAEIKKALELRPDDPSILNEWAYMSALDKVDLVEALEAVERAIELQLAQPFTPLSIDPGESMAQWEIERAESVGAYLDTRGWLYYQLGRHHEAVSELELASLMTSDGTVQGHLGRARYAVGNDAGAFPSLLRALALGCEDSEEVQQLAAHLYDKLHVVPGGLEALIAATRSEMKDELSWAAEEYDPQPRPGPGDRPTAPSRAHHPLIGTKAPGFVATTLDGKKFALEDLRGRVVVVDFWATWCGPCVEAMPAYDAISRAFAGEGVVFVALSLDEDPALVREFWSFPGTPMRVAMGDPKTADLWRVQGIPATFVVDKKGFVRDHHAGFDPATAERLTRTLVGLMTE
jgi:thiol-disulfide isomerase/thioredoxin/tetratricopeptide (TPR) repeat protein